MLKRVYKKTFLLFSLLIISSNSFAAAYVGGGIGKSDYDSETSYGAFDDPMSFEIIGGADISPNAAFEVTFVNFGEASDGDPSDEWTLSATSLTFGGLFKAPISPTAEAFLKVGLHMWDYEVESEFFGKIDEDDGTDLFFGFGGNFKVSPTLKVGVRYMSYDIDDDDVTNLSFNVTVGI